MKLSKLPHLPKDKRERVKVAEFGICDALTDSIKIITTNQNILSAFASQAGIEPDSITKANQDISDLIQRLQYAKILTNSLVNELLNKK